jgi:transposase InsO family protein
MTTKIQPKHVYDHRLRNLVRETGNIDIALKLGVPRSTATGWLTAPMRPVISHELSDLSDVQIQARILKLEARLKIVTAIMILLLAVLRVFRHKLDWERLPEAETKEIFLRAIERACRHLPLTSVLSIIGLSATRYHTWTRAMHNNCPLDDQSSCPKTHPTQLLPADLQTMRDLATSPEYRHVPTGRLAILAQRLGKVFASSATWCREVRDRGWRRPRIRMHPANPTTGIRADKPNEMWHVDVTVIRLLNGTKVYLQGIIDNYSRRILAWRLTEKIEPAATATLLIKAFQSSISPATKDNPQALMIDGGIENINTAVNLLCEQGILKTILAQTDIHFSNSMIEAFWRALKHQWLFLNNLNSIEDVRRLTEFYITEYNVTLPHSAFNGQTPDEMYFGTGNHIAQQIEAGKQKAREERLEANRATDCDACRNRANTLAISV